MIFCLYLYPVEACPPGPSQKLRRLVSQYPPAANHMREAKHAGTTNHFTHS
jgi:hypothetical protein